MRCFQRRLWFVVATSLLVLACNRRALPFLMVGADSSIVGSSQYPVAVDPKKVGTYPAETKSGAGYFYDDVLEYRVWFHPEQGAQKLNGDADYYEAFAQYERAEEVSMARQGAEPPLVLIRQREWINEPEPGHYIPEKGDRLTEWQVEWLTGSHRTGESIREFLKHPRQSQLAEPPRQ